MDSQLGHRGHEVNRELDRSSELGAGTPFHGLWVVIGRLNGLWTTGFSQSCQSSSKGLCRVWTPCSIGVLLSGEWKSHDDIIGTHMNISSSSPSEILVASSHNQAEGRSTERTMEEGVVAKTPSDLVVHKKLGVVLEHGVSLEADNTGFQERMNLFSVRGPNRQGELGSSPEFGVFVVEAWPDPIDWELDFIHSLNISGKTDLLNLVERREWPTV